MAAQIEETPPLFSSHALHTLLGVCPPIHFHTRYTNCALPVFYDTRTVGSTPPPGFSYHAPFSSPYFT